VAAVSTASESVGRSEQPRANGWIDAPVMPGIKGNLVSGLCGAAKITKFPSAMAKRPSQQMCRGTTLKMPVETN